MSSSFNVHSAAGLPVSLLNTANISPMDLLYDHDDHASYDNSAVPGAAQERHTCAECDRSFTSSSHLSRHHTIHTGEKNHVCPFPGCGKTDTRGDNLVQHYRMHLPRGEHNRFASYVRSRMEQQMKEIAVAPVSSPPRRRRRVAHIRPSHVLADGPGASPNDFRSTSPCDSVSSDSTMCSNSPEAYEHHMSSPVVPPPLMLLSLAHAVLVPSSTILSPPVANPSMEAPSTHQPFTRVLDYSRQLPMSNAREE